MEEKTLNEYFSYLKETRITREKIISEMKNPIKKYIFTKKSKKLENTYLAKLKEYTYKKQIDIDFLKEIISYSTIYKSMKYTEKLDVFNQIEEIKAVYYKNDNVDFVIFLYPIRNEIRFVKYDEKTTKMIQYPRHVFIGRVSKETAVYEYDESMIKFIRDFIWEIYNNYLGGDSNV